MYFHCIPSKYQQIFLNTIIISSIRVKYFCGTVTLFFFKLSPTPIFPLMAFIHRKFNLSYIRIIRTLNIFSIYISKRLRLIKKKGHINFISILFIDYGCFSSHHYFTQFQHVVSIIFVNQIIAINEYYSSRQNV